MNTEPIFLVVDLFCGAGGTTTGFVQAEMEGNPIAKVIACVNHDPKAIESHWKNHPDVLHFEEDIRTLDLTRLAEHVNWWKERYPDAYVILWASLECTNFSKAKGGKERDADSRTLALHLFRYQHALKPDFIKIENVVEFMSWGPMAAVTTKTTEGFECCEFEIREMSEAVIDEDGLYHLSEDGSVSFVQKLKPVFKGVPTSRNNGKDWLRWCKTIDRIGYYNEWKQLNSADFGAYTSRNRLFGCFATPTLPVFWPAPTHTKNPVKGSLFNTDLKKWQPVKEVLDFADEGKSIFLRDKPLSEKTLERIFAGLIKYIAKGDSAFISKYFSGRPAGKVDSVENPSATITTFGNNSLVQVEPFISNFKSGHPASKNTSVESPLGAITTVPTQSVVTPVALLKYNSTDKTGQHYPPSVEEPSPVITTQNRIGLIQGEFLTHYYSNGGQHSSVEQPAPVIPTKARTALVSPEFLTIYNGKSLHRSVDEPSPVIPTNDRLSLVQPEFFIDKHFGAAQNQSIDQPAGTVMPNDKHRLVEAVPFIMPTNFNNGPKSVDEPAPVITASRKHHYIINPSWGGNPGSVDEPCCVVVARQDKAPLYFVQVEAGPVRVAVYETDSPVMIQIKQFMAIYGLIDIKMRMLRVSELLKIQGFPADYQLAGNQSDQKKFIGNSVVPQVVKSWTEAMAGGLLRTQKEKVA